MQPSPLLQEARTSFPKPCLPGARLGVQTVDGQNVLGAPKSRGPEELQGGGGGVYSKGSGSSLPGPGPNERTGRLGTGTPRTSLWENARRSKEAGALPPDAAAVVGEGKQHVQVAGGQGCSGLSTRCFWTSGRGS